MESTIQNVFEQEAYEIKFDSYELESKLSETFDPSFCKQLISRMGILSGGVTPLKRYLDYAVEATEYFSSVESGEIEVKNMGEILRKLDVSDSLNYLAGDGLSEVVSQIENTYNETLQMIDDVAPFLNVKNRYSFTNHSKKFCHIYLAHSLKSFVNTMVEHQNQLKKTCKAYSYYLSEKKSNQSARFIAKIAGSLVAGVLGSLSVTALFAGINSSNERRFGQELSKAHQTWYGIQASNMHQTVFGNYSIRLYNLYLSLIGGLFLKVSQDLAVVGLQLKNYYPNSSKVELGLTDEAEIKYRNYLDDVLNKEDNMDEVFHCIRTIASKSYLNYLTDSNYNLYIERLYVHYFYLQAKLVLDNNEVKDLPKDMKPIYWHGTKYDEYVFSFLEADEYEIIHDTIFQAFEKEPEKMAALYAEVVDLNKLYVHTDKPSQKKVYFDGPLTSMHFIANFFGKENVPLEWWENNLDNRILTLINGVEDDEEVRRRLKNLAELWIGKDYSEKESVFAKLKNIFVSKNPLDEAIQNLDYRRVLMLLDKGYTVDSIEITKELVSLQYRPLLRALSNSLKNINLIINQDIIADILEKDDMQAMNLLLKLGLDPFMSIGDRYLLANIMIYGSRDMIWQTCDYCQTNIDSYKSILMSLHTKFPEFPSPYYFLHILGFGYFTKEFPELFQYIPIKAKRYDFLMVLSAKCDEIAYEMFENDPEIIAGNDNENSILESLISGSNYMLLNKINDEYPEILKTLKGNKTILRYVYELGYIDMAEHFHGVFQIHDIGEVYIEEIESAVYNLERNYLILLKARLTDFDDVLEEIKRQAINNGEWPIVNLIEDVLVA